MKRNQSKEDYLETIFLLGRDGAPVHSADIARALKYSPVSVGNALLRLVKDSTIQIDNMKHIHLTEKGYARAVKTYEKHIFFMNFLMALGLGKEEASNEACDIEHGISDKVFELIKESFYDKPCGRLGFCPGAHLEHREDDAKTKVTAGTRVESDA